MSKIKAAWEPSQVQDVIDSIKSRRKKLEGTSEDPIVLNIIHEMNKTISSNIMADRLKKIIKILNATQKHIRR